MIDGCELGKWGKMGKVDVLVDAREAVPEEDGADTTCLAVAVRILEGMKPANSGHQQSLHGSSALSGCVHRGSKGKGKIALTIPKYVQTHN